MYFATALLGNWSDPHVAAATKYQNNEHLSTSPTHSIQPILSTHSSSILDPPSLKRRLASSKADLSGMPVTPLDMFRVGQHVTYTTNISPRSWTRSFHPCNSKSPCFHWRCMLLSALRARRTLCSHPRPPSRSRIWKRRTMELSNG